MCPPELGKISGIKVVELKVSGAWAEGSQPMQAAAFAILLFSLDNYLRIRPLKTKAWQNATAELQA
jgi:hypothetical protein